MVIQVPRTDSNHVPIFPSIDETRAMALGRLLDRFTNLCSRTIVVDIEKCRQAAGWSSQMAAVKSSYDVD